MPWLKLSEPIFSLAYFKHLFFRYLWLIYVPLCIFFGFVFLFAVLNLSLEPLGFLLFPYAAFIVPCTALILFHVYTKKTDAAHLFSMPLTRRQNFISTYLAGISLILIPLMVMSFVYSFTDFGKSEITFILGMFFLTIIYYSFAVFGCLLGGTMPTQLMMMGVISFGPLILYAIINFCISTLAIGDLSSNLNDTIVSSFCPLFSGIKFIFDGSWPYFYVHIPIVIAVVIICLFLVSIRPFELAGQSVLFDQVQRYFMKPILYLNIVYVIFYFCATTLSEENYFDTAYYGKMVALLACTGIMVSFIFNVWSSHDLRSLFDWRNIQQTFLMTLLACSLFLIPLRQKENERLKISEGEIFVILTYPEYRYSMSKIYTQDEDVSKISQILEYIDDTRQDFLTKPYYQDKSALSVSFHFENGTYQSYYVLPENVSGYTETFLCDFLISQREETLDRFVNDQVSPFYQNEVGNLYDRNAIGQAIESSYLMHMPKQYFENFVNQSDENSGKDLFDLYLQSLTEENYDVWENNIFSQIKPVLDATTLSNIEEICTQALLSGKYLIDDNSETRKITENVALNEVLDKNNWFILEVSERMVHLKVPVSATMKETIETDQSIYFEDSDVTLWYDVTLENINDNWQMKMITLEEVNY